MKSRSVPLMAFNFLNGRGDEWAGSGQLSFPL